MRASLQDKGTARSPSTDLPAGPIYWIRFSTREYIPNYSIEQAAPTVGSGLRPYYGVPGMYFSE